MLSVSASILIKHFVGGQKAVAVLRYGSDPLKTYLPESDVDITVIVNEQTAANIATSNLTPLTQLKM
jgi:DNA polymerase sigma